MGSLRWHAPSLRRIAVAWLAALATALCAAGCDTGGRSTRVHGPEFVGFGYTPQTLEGKWSGTLSSDAFFQTVLLEVDSDAVVVEGRDSRNVRVDEGSFEFTDTATGELDFGVRMEDGVAIGARGVLEPGANRISAIFASNVGLVGQVVLARTHGAGTFDASLLAGTYHARLLPAGSSTGPVGELLVDRATGEFTEGSRLGNDAVTGGGFDILESEVGLVAVRVNLATGDSLLLFGLVSLADGRVAGFYEESIGSDESFFTLDPVDGTSP